MYTGPEMQIEEVDAILSLDLSSGWVQIDYGKFLVGLESLDDRGPWVGLDTTTYYSGNSWYYDATGSVYFNLSETEFAFNAMVSAVILIP